MSDLYSDPLFPPEIPGDLYSITRDNYFAEYMGEMRFRHPIMYYLWYRWWLMRLVPPKCVPYVKKSMCERNINGRYRVYWAAFALHHPVLFFLWTVFRVVFQFVVKLFTLPIKVVLALKSQIVVIGFDNTRAKDELAQKGEDVPSGSIRVIR